MIADHFYLYPKPPDHSLINIRYLGNDSLLMILESGALLQPRILLYHKPTNKWLKPIHFECTFEVNIPDRLHRSPMKPLIFTGAHSFVVLDQEIHRRHRIHSLHAKLLFFALSEDLTSVRLTKSVPLLEFDSTTRWPSLHAIYQDKMHMPSYLYLTGTSINRLYKMSSNYSSVTAILEIDAHSFRDIAANYGNTIYLVNRQQQKCVLRCYDIPSGTLDKEEIPFALNNDVHEICMYGPCGRWLMACFQSHMDLYDLQSPRSPPRRLDLRQYKLEKRQFSYEWCYGLVGDGELVLSVGKMDEEQEDTEDVQLWTFGRMETPKLAEISLRTIHRNMPQCTVERLHFDSVKNVLQLISFLLGET